MFRSGGDRDAHQIFVQSAWESDNRPYIRGSLITPQAAYPLTQDPSHVSGAYTSRYRHLPVGVTSWPPNVAASDKIRSGQVTHASENGLKDLYSMNLFDLQAITTTAISAFKLSGLDIPPVEDVYFAVQPIKESSPSAIQQL